MPYLMNQIVEEWGIEWFDPRKFHLQGGVALKILYPPLLSHALGGMQDSLVFTEILIVLVCEYVQICNEMSLRRRKKGTASVPGPNSLHAKTILFFEE